MRIAILTNEYPPNVYGGAGVHVEYLTRELARLDDGRHHVRRAVLRRSSGGSARSLRVEGVPAPVALPAQDPRHTKLFDTMLRDLDHERQARRHRHRALPHVVHASGRLRRQSTCSGAPLVLTTHSLEPHRPWKVEQLGTAYHVSTWIERTAYENADGVVAVSASMKRDVHELYACPARADPRDPQRHRSRAVPAKRPIRRCSPSTTSRPTSRTCSSSDGSRGRRASSTW